MFSRAIFTRESIALVDLQVQALTILADKLTDSNNNFRMFSTGHKYRGFRAQDDARSGHMYATVYKCDLGAARDA